MKNSKQNCLSINFNFEALLLLVLLLFDSHAASKTGNAQPPINITAVTGVSVELKCKVRLQECGNFFSIEWYRDNTVAFRDSNVEDESEQTKSKQMSGRAKREESQRHEDPEEHFWGLRQRKIIDNFINNSWSELSEFEKKKNTLRHRRHGGIKIFFLHTYLLYENLQLAVCIEGF